MTPHKRAELSCCVCCCCVCCILWIHQAPSGQLRQARLLQTLLDSGKVTMVSPDPIATITATQASAPWGLDRIDELRGTDTTYDYNSVGSDVTVFVLDTGTTIWWLWRVCVCKAMCTHTHTRRHMLWSLLC